MKKTLLITLDFYPKIGGVANYYFNLCQNLSEDKILVLTELMEELETSNQKSETRNQKLEISPLLSSGDNSRDNKADRPKGENKKLGEGVNFKIIRESLMSNWAWPHWLPMLKAISKIIKQEKIDILWAGDIWPTGLAVYLNSIFSGKPYIVSIHGRDLLLVKRNKLKSFLAKIILKRAAVVTANSQSTSKIVESFGVSKEKIKVVYPGVEKQEYKNTTCLPARQGIQEYKKTVIKKYNLVGKKILLSIGRLVERKGFDKVIEAMPEVLREVKDVVYVVVGEGPDRGRLEQKSKKAKNQENKETEIIFAGQVSDEEKWAWLELCDVFIMPARAGEDDVEGFGIVYLEAAVAGKPVIAGKSGGASEAVIDRETGILVEPENHEEIAGAIIKLFKDEGLRKKMGGQGKARAEKYFNWGILIKKMEEALS